MNRSGAITSPAEKAVVDPAFLQRFRTVTLIAVIAAALGSEGLMLFASRHNPSGLIRVLFIIWVLLPFAGLFWMNLISKRWSAVTRATLYVETLVITLGSSALYAAVVLSPPKAQAASRFIVIPPVSWLLILTVVPIVALISRRKTASGRRIFRVVAMLATLGILAIGTLLISLWLEQRKQITLPMPTGPFAVGRVIQTWPDDAYFDTVAPIPGTKRELLVWIWYPAAGRSGATSDYLPAEVRAPREPAGGSSVFKLLTRDLSKVHAHGADNADVSPQEQSYPVVILRAGASAPVLNYTTLTEDLASHGYVVVGFDAPYRTTVVAFPDGRVMNRTPQNDCEERKSTEQLDCFNKLLGAWTTDMTFVLDRLEQLNTSQGPDNKFAGRLDLTRVGAFGHSFGGAQALQFCHDDSRCKAGIDIDGRPLGSVIREGVHQPFMFLVSAQIHSSDPENRQVKGDIQSIYDRLPADGRLFVAIRGANHYTFSDDGALLKSELVRRTLRAFGALGIDGQRQLAVTAYCVRSFFDAHLKHQAGLKISSESYPEIEILQ